MTEADAIVLFGATGDLSVKKIFPALQAMIKKGHLTVPVIGVAKANRALDQLRDRVRESLSRFGGGVDEAALAKLVQLLRYVYGDYREEETFVRLRQELGGAREGATLQRIYTEMAPANMSKDLFEKIPGHLLVTPVEKVGWSDWGSPERILRTLRRYGKALCLKGAGDAQGEGFGNDNEGEARRSGAGV